MVKTRIIPCLLLKNGRCVKGVNFKNHRDVGHPVTNAKIYDSQGADELVLIDITRNMENRDLLLGMIKETADRCFMPLTVGGGIRTLEDIESILNAGADKILINTFAVNNEYFIKQAAERFGKQCIIVSVDYKINSKNKLEVFIFSGKKSTGLNPIDWAERAEELGAGEILLTNIDREGTRTGYDIELIKILSDKLSIPLIANGGAGSLEHLKDAIMEAGASAVGLGSILHFTDQNVIKVRDYLHTNKINVRINV